MAFEPESPSPLDALWKEYARAFQAWDDLTLARWLAQTLGQLEGRAWRLSHPLVGAYRLGAQIRARKTDLVQAAGHAARRLCGIAVLPRAVSLPLLTRDVRESGLICQHCSETLVPFEEIPADIRAEIETWAQQYEPVHAVAHWDDRQRRGAGKLRCGFRKCGGTGGAVARTRGPRTYTETAASLSDHHLGRSG